MLEIKRIPSPAYIYLRRLILKGKRAYFYYFCLTTSCLRFDGVALRVTMQSRSIFGRGGAFDGDIISTHSLRPALELEILLWSYSHHANFA